MAVARSTGDILHIPVIQPGGNTHTLAHSPQIPTQLLHSKGEKHDKNSMKEIPLKSKIGNVNTTENVIINNFVNHSKLII